MAITTQALPLQTARQRRTLAVSYFRLGRAGILSGAVVAVCILSILYLAQTGRVSTRGYHLQELQAEEKSLLREGDQYQYRVAEANRLTVIQERAAKLGLRPAVETQTRYIQVELDRTPVVAQR